MSVPPIEERLAALHAHYVTRVNAAVAAGRMDLVRDLADEYEDEALDLMLALEDGTSSRREHGSAETLEFGRGTPYRPAARRPGTGWFRFWRRSNC